MTKPFHPIVPLVLMPFFFFNFDQMRGNFRHWKWTFFPFKWKFFELILMWLKRKENLKCYKKMHFIIRSLFFFISFLPGGPKTVHKWLGSRHTSKFNYRKNMLNWWQIKCSELFVFIWKIPHFMCCMFVIMHSALTISLVNF